MLLVAAVSHNFQSAMWSRRRPPYCQCLHHQAVMDGRAGACSAFSTGGQLMRSGPHCKCKDVIYETIKHSLNQYCFSCPLPSLSSLQPAEVEGSGSPGSESHWTDTCQSILGVVCRAGTEWPGRQQGLHRPLVFIPTSPKFLPLQGLQFPSA